MAYSSKGSINSFRYVDDPWPTYQVAQEAERLLKEGYRFKLREVHLARDQWSTQEAQFKAKMQELRAVWTKEQCQGLEKCSESARLGLKASQPLSSTSLEIQSLTRNLQDSSKPLKAPGVGLRSQAVEVDGIETPSIKPQDAEDKLGVNERPIKAAAHALEVPELVPEPRGDLCEVPDAAAVEIYTGLSQKSKNYLFEGYEVKAPHSAGWSAILKSTVISSTRKSTNEAALRVRTPEILCKKKWMPPSVKGEAQQL
ncbi:hypothetical protein EDD16DRAFT_1702725 [Pisolithus croceorrhizus]|nr:hypothetical protein EDD16DRAFT_1702725 [Pisolithus croceorrhizus]